MEKVGSFAAKTHLPRLLDKVARGERFTITRNGLPVAILIPFEEQRAEQVGEVIARIKELRDAIAARAPAHPAATPGEIREMIAEGRNW